jgi:hypothetical protein
MTKETLAMADRADEQFTAWQEQRSRPIDTNIDQAPQPVRRAFQHGGIGDEEFTVTLDRLDKLPTLKLLEYKLKQRLD